MPLVTHRGSAPDFGSGREGLRRHGHRARLRRDDNPITAGESPFKDNPYRPGRQLSGRSTARRHRAAGRCGSQQRRARDLHCLTLDISRAVPETLSRATAGYRRP